MRELIRKYKTIFIILFIVILFLYIIYSYKDSSTAVLPSSELMPSEVVQISNREALESVIKYIDSSALPQRGKEGFKKFATLLNQAIETGETDDQLLDLNLYCLLDKFPDSADAHITEIRNRLLASEQAVINYTRYNQLSAGKMISMPTPDELKKQCEF